MNDYKKTKVQLIEELIMMRQSYIEAHNQITELDSLAVEYQKAEMELNHLLITEITFKKNTK